jgi:hypothetical protein
MLGLHDLRGDTEANIARLLDTTVHIDVAIVDDEDEKVGRLVVPVECQSMF